MIRPLPKIYQKYHSLLPARLMMPVFQAHGYKDLLRRKDHHCNMIEVMLLIQNLELHKKYLKVNMNLKGLNKIF